MAADKMGFHASFFLNSLQEETRKCLWLRVCDCVSLQCSIPAIIPALFSATSFPPLSGSMEVVKNRFYEEQLLHFTLSQTLVIQAQYC